MRRLVGLLLVFPALLSAQVLDSSRAFSSTRAVTDSVVHWYTQRVTVQAPPVTDTLYCDPQFACSRTKPLPPVVEPIPEPVVVYPLGKPFGPVSAYTSYTTIVPGPWTSTFQASSAGGSPPAIVQQIDAARARKIKLTLAMTGGAHSNYMTNGVFDRKKWDAKMATYNTAAIREAIAKGVADGTIVGASVMDEPHVSGSGDGNTWGPVGTMTKVRVDSLCRSVKAMFPTLPAGVAHRWDIFETAKSYQDCDFIVSPYMAWVGNATAYRDGAMAMAQRDKIGILFSLNILDGGWRVSGCPVPQTGGPGTYGVNCRMTAAQVTEYGKTFLGSSACGLLFWKHDDRFLAKAENIAAFADLASYAAKQPAPPCRRP